MDAVAAELGLVAVFEICVEAGLGVGQNGVVFPGKLLHNRGVPVHPGAHGIVEIRLDEIGGDENQSFE